MKSANGQCAAIARRRWPLAVLLLLMCGALNLLNLQNLRNSQVSEVHVDAVTDSEAKRDCATMDKYHLDPLFAAQAECLTQPQVVDAIRQLVFTAVKLFETYNVTYFLDSGTLLGAFRDQRVIPHDTDADVAIDVTGYDFIRENRVDVPEEFFLAVYASGDLYPGSVRDKEIPVRLIHKSTALYLDVFVFSDRGLDAATGLEMVGPQPSWSFERCVGCGKYYNQGKQLLVPREWIFPTVECEFEGKKLQCPRQTDKYLRYMYGDDYRTPISWK